VSPQRTSEEWDVGSAELAAHCLGVLRARGESLAAAESLTAGLITATVAAVPGASDVLRGGLAAYATDVKCTVLGVDAALIEKHGVVSRECAGAMAARARAVFASDWAVAATGVAGPDEQDGHPVGEVYVAVAGPEDVQVEQLSLVGDRSDIRSATVDHALAVLERTVVAALDR
jgi:nicotinamide-nucleotide amidase